MKKTYTELDLIESVKVSYNFCEVCRKLGIKHTGGNSYERVRNKIKDLGLDTSHFKGKRSAVGVKNGSFTRRKTAEQILTKHVPNRLSHRILKRALIETGIEYKCIKCGIIEWMDSPITLDIDHLDGDWSNCEKNNLRFICPNCHRQTDTYGGKNIKGIIV